MRRVFTLASAISFLLLFAIVFLWVRSYWVGDDLQWDRGTRHLEIAPGRGDVYLQYDDFPIFHIVGVDRIEDGWKYRRDPKPRKGVVFYNMPGVHKWGPVTYLEMPQFLVFPYWIPALLFAVLPIVWGIAEKRRRRKNRTVCPKCHYNLTGNTSGTCPECGTLIPQAPRPA